MAENQKEVNNVDVDKVELESSESEDGDDEVITKPEDIEEKETPSDKSSTEKEPSGTEEDEEEGDNDKEKLITKIRQEEGEEKEGETSESEEDKGFVESSEDDSEDEIKRLDNETPREYALRLEVTRLKRGNREKRTKDLLGEEKQEKPPGVTKTQFEELSEDEKSLLGQYDPNELSTFEKILDVLAKKHGWVKKKDLASTTKSRISDDILDDFLQGHPEYLPENDKDDVLWNSFKSEFQLYKIPDNPKDLKIIFKKIHRHIFGVKPEDGLKKIGAQKEKLKVVSHSGGSATRGQSSSKGTNLTTEQKSHLKGFTEEELEEM